MDNVEFLFLISISQMLMGALCLLPTFIPGWEWFCEEKLGCYDLAFVPFKMAFIMVGYGCVNCLLAYMHIIPG
jgi:hypothetical protein